MTINELGLKYGTDKGTRHSYLDIYENVLGHLRNEPIVLLEIGVDQGRSMRMWLEYFPKARTFGIDELIRQQIGDTVMIGIDQQSPRLRQIFSLNSLDVVIDDGSHVPWHQHATCHNLIGSLKRGAYYFIEDLPEDRHIEAWRSMPGFQVWPNHKNGVQDDILVMWRNP
jgi:hypothetical protein